MLTQLAETPKATETSELIPGQTVRVTHTFRLPRRSLVSDITDYEHAVNCRGEVDVTRVLTGTLHSVSTLAISQATLEGNTKANWQCELVDVYHIKGVVFESFNGEPRNGIDPGDQIILKSDPHYTVAAINEV